MLHQCITLIFLINKIYFSLQHGIGVEFVRVLPETHPPVLSNIFCECDSKDDVVIIIFIFIKSKRDKSIKPSIFYSK